MEKMTPEEVQAAITKMSDRHVVHCSDRAILVPSILSELPVIYFKEYLRTRAALGLPQEDYEHVDGHLWIELRRPLTANEAFQMGAGLTPYTISTWDDEGNAVDTDGNLQEGQTRILLSMRWQQE